MLLYNYYLSYDQTLHIHALFRVASYLIRQSPISCPYARQQRTGHWFQSL